MESPKRTLVKAVTWQVTGLVSMTLLGLLISGSLEVAGSLAVASTVVGLIMYVLHERLWARLSWGIKRAGDNG